MTVSERQNRTMLKILTQLFLQQFEVVMQCIMLIEDGSDQVLSLKRVVLAEVEVESSNTKIARREFITG